MHIRKLVALALIAAPIGLVPQARAQVSLSVQLGRRLGPEISVSTFSQDRWGNWRDNYRHWRPVTLYEYDGHFYRHSVRGARAVQVYSYNREYFMPPQDQGWIGTDHRYNYRRRPRQDDYDHARPADSNGRP